MELYNAEMMPLSNDSTLRIIEKKILRGETLTLREKMIAGRDHPINKILGYKLKPDHCYRAVSERTFQKYLETGFIIGESETDEYEEYIENGKSYNNNKGVDWYLGGVSLRYGNIILECPADKKYFMPANDNGTRLSFDPNIRHFKSSGARNPVPMTMITNVFDVKGLQDKKDNENLEQQVKIIDLDYEKMALLRDKKLLEFNQNILNNQNNHSKSL